MKLELKNIFAGLFKPDPVEAFRKACGRSTKDGADAFIAYADNLDIDPDISRRERFEMAWRKLDPKTPSQVAALRRATREYKF